MSIGKRIERLEGQLGVDKEPMFIFISHPGLRKLTEEEKERLIKEAVERNPGQHMYTINHPDRGKREKGSENHQGDK